MANNMNNNMATTNFTYRHPFLTPLTPSMPCPPLVHDTIESLPMTPPDPISPDPDQEKFTTKPSSNAIKLALHVISTERAALENLETLYATDPTSRSGLSQSIDIITRTCQNYGKLVITGVGKSGKIGDKLVATFNSLGIQSCALHPTEALHGDLGVIKPNDTVLMITYSGRTAELLGLLPHIPTHIPLIVMTSHLVANTCPLLYNRPNSILLPAPIHESETVSFGLAAPTTSTTVALAIGDGLALAVADRLHTSPGRSPADVFHSYHPGGAIGATAALSSMSSAASLPALLPEQRKMSDLATPVDAVPIATPTNPDGGLTCLDILLTAVRSPSGWVRVSPEHIIAPRRVQRLAPASLTLTPVEMVCEAGQAPFVIERPDWISVLGSCTVEESRRWILQMRQQGRGKEFLKQGTVLGLVDARNEVSSVVEIEDVVGEDLSG